MRVASRSFGFLVVVVGCSGEVITSSGGNGGSGGNTGGSGGAVGGSGGAATGGAGGSGGTATGGAGGGTGGVATGGAGGAMGNLCDQGCAHAQQCFGFDVCALPQLNLDCSTGMYECQGQCINGASCAQLQTLATMSPDPAVAGCLQACQGGGGGAGGAGVQACTDCSSQNCVAQLPMGCSPFGMSPFAGWVDCAQGCSDPACFAQCDAANPGAANCYGALYTCQCATCAADCQAITNPCGQAGGAGGAGGGGAGGN